MNALINSPAYSTARHMIIIVGALFLVSGLEGISHVDFGAYNFIIIPVIGGAIRYLSQFASAPTA